MSKAPSMRTGLLPTGLAATTSAPPPPLSSPQPLQHRGNNRGVMPVRPTSPLNAKSGKVPQPPTTHSAPVPFRAPPAPLDYVDDYYYDGDEVYEEYIGDYSHQTRSPLGEKVQLQRSPTEQETQEVAARRRVVPQIYAPDDYYYSSQSPQSPPVGTSQSQTVPRKRVGNPSSTTAYEDNYYAQQTATRRSVPESYQGASGIQSKVVPSRIVSHPQQGQQQQPRKRMMQTIPNQCIPQNDGASARRPLEIPEEFVYQTRGDHNSSTGTRNLQEPRFARRTPTTHLFKRPSALCLPIGMQNDRVVHRPAPPPPSAGAGGGIVRKIKRLTNTNCQRLHEAHREERTYPPNHGDNVADDGIPDTRVYHELEVRAAVVGTTGIPPMQHQEQQTTTTAIVTPDGKMLNGEEAQERLHSVLSHYERIFEKREQQAANVQQAKPRTPPCIKEARERTEAGQQTQTKGKLPEMMQSAETLGVEEFSEDMLDSMMAQLSANGMNDITTDPNGKQRILQTMRRLSQADREQTTTADGDGVCQPIITEVCPQAPPQEVPKSLNYQEIKESLIKSKQERYAGSETSTKTVCQDATSKPSEMSTMRSDMKILPKMIAEQAHQTKSCVMDLIDVALSRHFGLCDKHDSKRRSKPPDTRSVVEMIKKYSSLSTHKSRSRDLAEDIAHALNEARRTRSRQSNASSKVASVCSCRVSHGKRFTLPRTSSYMVHQALIGDATCFGNLQQMRLCYLKHIEREVQNLRQLEHILEHCKKGAIDKCHYH